MTKKLLIAIAVFNFAFGGIFTHFYRREDDLSLRYVLWKKGLHPYASDIVEHAFLADKNRVDLISGKSKEQIRQIFPSAHEEAINDYQRFYLKELADKDYLWLGDWGTVIFLRDGVVESVSCMKG